MILLIIFSVLRLENSVKTKSLYSFYNRKNMLCNIRFSKNKKLREADLSKLNR
jgi:hypothetical protein